MASLNALIRRATEADADAIRAVHLAAFPDGEAATIAALAIDLLGEQTRPETVGLVAQIDGRLVGHVAFSPLWLDVDPAWRGYILAPLAVVPASQKQGIGKLLVGAVIDAVAQAGADSLFVYGDPDYYGRFGFSAEAAAAYAPPYPLEFAHGWLARQIGTVDTRATGRLTCVESLRNPVLW